MARFGNFDQYLDNAGDPLVEGKLYFYESGTTTPKTTYSDVNNSIPNTNPVLLSAAGRQPNIFFDGVAKVILTDNNDVQIAVRDPVGETATDFGDEWVASKIYSSNDVVLGSDGIYYRSLVNGNQNNNPVTSSGYWTLLYSVEWNSGITYSAGDVVLYGSTQYQSLQSSNLNNNPASATTYWAPLNFMWVATATYSEDQNVVGTDGILYTSLQNSNTGNDPATSPSYWVGTSAAAAASATAAAASATAASASETAAAASETAAAASETAAAASETAAAASESAASTSATNAASSASAASTSETNAAASETAAAASASAASTSETNAAASASAASTSETNAAASETAAAASETAAAASESAAATSETNAANSASAASTSASNASTSATNAASSATAAAGSATAAAGSATSAATSASDAAAKYDEFDDRYLGEKASDPSVDNDGNPLVTGALYFNNASNTMKVYDGAAWVNVAPVATSVTLSQVTDFPSQSGNSGKYLTTNGTTPSWAALSTDPTLGTLTKTFTSGESSTISLSSSVLAPVVSVTKEVPQTGVTNNNWDVNSTTENYTRLNSAYATTLTPSATGDGTFTLGTGSFAAGDVGKTIIGNGGVAILAATDGSYVTTTDFTDTSAIASGDWEMYGVVYNAADGDLELSGTVVDGFDISTASYLQAFSVTAQDSSPYGIEFNNDGTKMFVLGTSGDDVNEYTLSTAFDVSTATYSQNFSVAAQDLNPSGIAFNTDGTKMFIVGGDGDDVNEYTLGTGFDISTASYSQNFSVASQETQPSGIAFNNDGTKMFVIGAVGDDVNEYTLSTGFDVSTASYSQNFSVSAQEDNPQDIAFNADGTKMYILGFTGQDVNEYTLGTGFDVSTATYSQNFSVSSQETGPRGLTFNTNGTKMYVIGQVADSVIEYDLGSFVFVSGYNAVHTTQSTDSTYWTDINSMTADQAAGDGNVYYAISTDDRTTWTVIDNTDGERDIVRNNGGTWQYNSNGTYASETWVNGTTNTELATLAEAMEGAADVTNAFDVSTAVYSQAFNVSAQETAPEGLAFNADGTKMFVIGVSGDDVNEYTLSSGFDVSTATYSQSFSVSGQEDNPMGITFNTDGTKMFIVGTTGDDVNEYTLSTGFDVSTATYSQNFSVAAQETFPQDIAFNTDGTKMFITGTQGDDVNEYTLGTGFDVSTATYSQSFSVSSQDTGPQGLAFNGDGTKMFITGSTSDSVFEYTLGTGFDVSTATYSQSFSVASQNTSPRAVAFNNNGSKMFVLEYVGDNVHEYTIGTTTYTNQMDKTQLDAVTDPNHIALGNDLDLAIIFNMTSGTTVPSSDGVSINYDANVLNKGAVLGTDYDFDAPAQDKVRITALAGNNLKVRVV